MKRDLITNPRATKMRLPKWFNKVCPNPDPPLPFQAPAMVDDIWCAQTDRVSMFAMIGSQGPDLPAHIARMFALYIAAKPRVTVPRRPLMDWLAAAALDPIHGVPWGVLATADFRVTLAGSPGAYDARLLLDRLCAIEDRPETIGIGWMRADLRGLDKSCRAPILILSAETWRLAMMPRAAIEYADWDMDDAL